MEQQQQVVAQIEVCLELLEHASEADEDMEVNAVMLMGAMNRLAQLLATPTARCEGQTAFAKQEDIQ